MRGRLAVATAAVFVGLVSGAAPARAASPSIVVTPDSALRDGQNVRVTGSGFVPSSHYEIFECARGATDVSRCDPRNAFEVDSNPSGVVTFPFKVDAHIQLGPSGVTEYDCRAERAGCEIGVGILVDVRQAAVAPIAFAAGTSLESPVSATVSPTTGLVDGQTVQVHGAGLNPGEAGWVIQCRTGGAPRMCDLDRAVRMKPTDTGRVDTAYTVHARFRTPLGDDIDCSVAPAACSIEVSRGFAFVPDRHVAVGLSFTTTSHTAVPPTTTPTSMPPTSGASRRSPGRSTALIVAACVLVVAVGTVLVLLRRRKRRTRATPMR